MESDVVRTLQKFLFHGFLVTGTYLLASWGISIAWLYCLLIILTFYNYWSEKKSATWKIMRMFALGDEKEILTSKLHILPSWVHFPDVERVEWLNKIIKQSWNSINGYMQELIPNIFEPIISQYVKGVKINAVQLGHVPLKIDGIKVYEATTRHKIVMDLDIAYAGNCKIGFTFKGLKGGVENIKARGKIRVILQPLISSLPLIGGLQIFYHQPPKIDFDLTGITQVLHISGLKTLIESYTLDIMNSCFLFPKMLPIKLSDEVQTPEVNTYEPEGVLRVNLIEAKNLMKKDIKLIGTDSSDPYGVIQVGQTKFKTKIISENINPKWDFWCEFEIDKESELKIHIWDHDDASKDETLGL